jgi:predicted DsbA family dithiol-disulfide isomerase
MKPMPGRRVSGVPLFLLNEKYAISGAQSADNFLNALKQVWEEKAGIGKNRRPDLRR